VLAAETCTCWELHVSHFVKIVTKDLTLNHALIKILSTASEERLEEARQFGVLGLPMKVVTERSDAGSDQDEEDDRDVENDDAFDLNMADSIEEGVDFGRIYHILQGRLAFVIHRDEAQTRLDILHRREIYFFSSDFHESYEAYCDDFGPVNLATVYSFCKMIKERLSDARLSERLLCYYAEKDLALRTNAAFLLAAYLLLGEGFSPEDAVRPLEALGPCAFLPFRDATHVRPSTFHLTLLDCMKGLRRAVMTGWFDLANFDLHKYCNMDNPALFDMHQVCPKLVAFRGPDCRDKHLRQPADFTGLFKRLGVTDVVRFNEVETYDVKEFGKDGIAVHDMQFEDCTTPPSTIVDRFLELVDNAQGVVAVHCLAGLGRTGTLISLWIMTHFGWSARECIAWLRVVRPGSVLGTQQHYLVACEAALAAKQPLPEPDAMAADRAARMARQVQVGMLKRRDRRRSSTSIEGGIRMDVLSIDDENPDRLAITKEEQELIARFLEAGAKKDAERTLAAPPIASLSARSISHNSVA